MITYNRDKKKLVIPAGIGQSAGVTGGVTKQEVIEIVDDKLEDYSTITYTDSQIQYLEGKIPSLDGYATTGYVDTKFEEVEGKIPDVSNFATKEELDDKVSEETLDNYKSEVSTALGNKADKTEIPDISGLATKAELEAVEDKIPSLDGYATETWVAEQGFLTEHQTLKTINGESVVGEGNITLVKNIQNVTGIWSGSREEYDAIEVKDNNTVYIIKS